MTVGADTCVILGGPHPWTYEAFQSCTTRYAEPDLRQWVWCTHPDRVAAHTPTWVFVLHWSEKIPAEIVRAWRCVNFHMTDVPYGRGGTPLQNLIARGHRATVLSAIRMTEGWDDGPVYLKAPLSLEGTAEEIYRRAMQMAVGMIGRLISEPMIPEPQTGEGTPFQRRTPDQSRLPVGATLLQLYDHIRMLDAEGYPRAFVEINGHRYTLSRPTVTDSGLHAEVLIT